MILYSVAAFSDVFPYECKSPKIMPIKYGYVSYENKNGEKVIQGICSTNPYDYISFDIKNR